MLTIDDIKTISFRKATLSAGYRAEDVDKFIDEVTETFEQQKKEKADLIHKIDRLAARLEEYKKDEETVRNALLTSQKMSDSCLKEAREKADQLLKEAEQKAETIVSDAEAKTIQEKQTYLRLHSDAVDLRNELIELYSKHIQTIDDLPTASDVEKSRSELEEKYPGVPDELPQKAAAEETPEAAKPEQPEEQQPEQQPEQAEQPAEEQPKQETEAPAAEEPASEKPRATEATTRVPIKRKSKFKHLKFGENYDVTDD